MGFWERWRNSHNSDSIVIEDSRDVFGGELVCRVADEQACLSDSTVADDNTPRGGKEWSVVVLSILPNAMRALMDDCGVREGLVIDQKQHQRRHHQSPRPKAR